MNSPAHDRIVAPEAVYEGDCMQASIASWVKKSDTHPALSNEHLRHHGRRVPVLPAESAKSSKSTAGSHIFCPPSQERAQEVWQGNVFLSCLPSQRNTLEDDKGTWHAYTRSSQGRNHSYHISGSTAGTNHQVTEFCILTSIF